MSIIREIGLFGHKTRILAFVVLMLSVQSIFGQNALTSVKINIQDIKVSKDLKTISYDVYLQDVDATYKVAIPGYGIQLAVPTTDLDPLKAKSVSTSNPCPLIGVRLPTIIINGSNWVMKFQNASSPLSYDGALLISETFPGTRLATINITNTDGSAFANPQQFTATFAGTTPSTKTTVSVFLEEVVSLAPNSTTAQPATNFTGLGVFNLSATTAALLTITGVTANNKVYDGTTSSTLSGGEIKGAVVGDVVSFIAGTGTFYDKNVGTSKVVTATGYSLGGADASKYVLSTQPSGMTANITPKALTVSNPAITLNKFYDGTTNAAVTTGVLSGVLAADVPNVSLSATASYNNALIGTGKTITVAYSLSGSASSNYTAPANYSVATGIITEAASYQLTVSAPTITLSKPYDGTNIAYVSAGTLSGVLASDVPNVSLSTTAYYDNSSVGTGKLITVAYSLSGSASGNYLPPVKTTVSTGIIFSKALTVSVPTITMSKTYDGSATAAVTAGTLSGILAADVSNVTLNATAAYNNASVGTGKTISMTYSLSGSAAGNYIAPVNSTVSTGVILLKAITISDPTITLSKFYDGTASAVVTAGIMSGILASDVANLTLIATASYSTGTVGTGKAITVTYSLSGSAAGNYLVPASVTISNGVILSKSLAVNAPTITLSKYYDGTTSAVATAGTLFGVLTADASNVTLNTIASYNNATVGTGKPINITYSLSGSSAGNYTAPVNSTVSTGIILSKALTASNPIITLSKTYDGTTRASVIAGTLSGILAADALNVSLNAIAFYANASVGVGKTITVAYNLSGSAAVNYVTPLNYSVATGVITDSTGSYTLSPTISDFEIYPNPTINGFYINAGEKVARLDIFDLSGRKLLTQNVMGKSYVNVDFLAKGIYVVYYQGVKNKIVKK